MKLSRQMFFFMSLATLVGFSAVAALIIYFFQDKTATQVFASEYTLWFQISLGIVYGILSSIIISALLELKFCEPVKQFFERLFVNIEVKWPDILFASFSAGVGEELFFRAGLQPFLGIWLTSILFIAIHSYIKMTKAWLFFGITMIVMSAGLGYLYEYVGLISAMAAHAAFDVMGFRSLLQRNG